MSTIKRFDPTPGPQIGGNGVSYTPPTPLVDRFGRKIDYLRISVTDRCNLRCTYCCPSGSFHRIPRSEMLSFERIRSFVTAAASLGIRKIRITGGEPLIRRQLPKLVEMISTIPGIEETCLTTNGLLLERYATHLRKAGLLRVNVSLDSLDAEKYRILTRGGRIDRVLAGIRTARDVGLVPVKVNVVRQPGVNDDELPAFEHFCHKEGLVLQVIERMDLSGERKGEGCHSPAMRPPPCGSCNKLRLTCDGRLYPCLFSSRYTDLGDEKDDAEAIRHAVSGKERVGRSFPHAAMSRIGG